MKKICSAISLALALTIACLSLVVPAFAAGVKVEKNPDSTSFYEGIDWFYGKSGDVMLTGGDLDLSGTVLSYGGKTVEYSTGKFGANMYTAPASGKWNVGKNTINVKCDSFDSVYATMEVNFVSVSSIAIVRAPKTKLVVGTDWTLGLVNDVEMTSFDLTGTIIDVTYSDSKTKRVSYPNALLGWSIEEGVDVVMPSHNTLYVTFCNHRAPFEVDFINETSFSRGDVNLDGAINSYDALCVLQCSTGSLILSSVQTELADVSADGKINSFDALRILQYAVGSISNL